ncbi:helix-turn-helix domain-containing protein [Paucibacter sp. B2R-40]|uniref:helix-turn-helix domain-containing protein n=1 Tax=Paucibacter sp. B2R-40 TaxID=2893554 RepID=UPI0021E50A00|nr:helix-turn-helix transcriptional regulator [Paucibacter sp. B2R-40]MCV2354278.1 helix-turn-helix domain-containing protein [Paucibacter sp. B2R-40]
MKNSPQNHLASALRKARNAAGLSQEEFGAVSGRTYISQLERGERQATLAKIDDLASVLQIHPAALVALAYLPDQAGEDAVEKLLTTVREELMAMLAAG